MGRRVRHVLLMIFFMLSMMLFTHEPAIAIPVYQEEVNAAQASVDASREKLEAIQSQYSEIGSGQEELVSDIRELDEARTNDIVELYKASRQVDSVLGMFLSCDDLTTLDRLASRYCSDAVLRCSDMISEKAQELLERRALEVKIAQELQDAQAEFDEASKLLEAAEQARYRAEEQLSRITAAQTNADLARTFCSLAYSRQARHDPTTGAYPGTEMYRRAYNAIWAAQGDSSWPAGKVGGRACDRGVSTAVVLSGFDDSFPRSCGDLSWGQWKHLTSSPRWANLGLWSGRESDLEPGDVLIRVKDSSPKATRNHVCMYVGHDIIMEVYENFLKGTDADVGEPDAKAAWVSSSFSNGLSGGNRGRAPGMGKDGDTAMNVFRCVAPQHSTKYTHVLE